MYHYEQPAPIFRDRTDAGQQLAERLTGYEGESTVVCAIPRGGVPVGIEVARHLDAAFDIVIVRKIPIPQEPEAGYGAVAEDGTIVLNEPMVACLALSRQEIAGQADAVREEILRRSKIFRTKLGAAPVERKTAIIIDDGLASGYTMLAAIESVRKRKASRVVVAVPVASGGAFELVSPHVDRLVAIKIAYTAWFAVASFYRNWYDLDDEEVLQYLERWQTTTNNQDTSSKQ